MHSTSKMNMYTKGKATNNENKFEVSINGTHSHGNSQAERLYSAATIARLGKGTSMTIL